VRVEPYVYFQGPLRGGVRVLSRTPSAADATVFARFGDIPGSAAAAAAAKVAHAVLRIGDTVVLAFRRPRRRPTRLQVAFRCR